MTRWPPSSTWASKNLTRLMIFTLLVLGVAGCASVNSKNQAATNSAYYKHLQEQQEIPGKYLYPKKLPKMTDEDYERLGDSYFRQGNLVDAFIQYDKLLQKHPGNSRLLYKRGMVYLLKDHDQEALADFRNALKKSPKNARIHEGVGRALFDLKRFDEAQKEFELALKLNDKLWLSHDYLGIIYDYKHQSSLAVRQYEAAIALNPDWGAVYNNLGVSWSLQERWDKAATAFEEAIKKGYSAPQVGDNLGLALCHLGRYPEALEAFRRSGDEAHAYNNLGSFYLQQGDYAEAIDDFQRAIQLRATLYPEANENLKKARAALDARISQNSTETARSSKEESHVVSKSASAAK